jgi:hypothetical protein
MCALKITEMRILTLGAKLGPSVLFCMSNMTKYV